MSRASFSKSMVDWTASEQVEEIREVKTNNIVLQGSFNEKENSLDQVTLSQDCSESQEKRLSL